MTKVRPPRHPTPPPYASTPTPPPHTSPGTAECGCAMQTLGRSTVRELLQRLVGIDVDSPERFVLKQQSAVRPAAPCLQLAAPCLQPAAPCLQPAAPCLQPAALCPQPAALCLQPAAFAYGLQPHALWPAAPPTVPPTLTCASPSLCTSPSPHLALRCAWPRRRRCSYSTFSSAWWAPSRCASPPPRSSRCAWLRNTSSTAGSR